MGPSHGKDGAPKLGRGAGGKAAPGWSASFRWCCEARVECQRCRDVLDIRVAAGKGVAGTFGAHKDGPVACVALSQNGYHAASGSDNGTVKMWDMRKAGQDGALMATFGVDGSVHDLSYDHYGKYATQRAGTRASTCTL